MVVRLPLHLIEFRADDPHRAGRLWAGVLGFELVDRSGGEGDVGRRRAALPRSACTSGAKRPGDTHSLPCFEVDDVEAELLRVREVGGELVHPGARWAVCRVSAGSPFGLAEPDA